MPELSSRRIYLTVAAVAIVVHLGALWNRFAQDDVAIILLNPVLRTSAGLWRAFLEPYWPPDFGGNLYRPLTIATFAIDRLLGQAWWFHLGNLLWHAGATVAVTVLARRWAGTTAALVAGLLFAVHPVHVEAVAYVVGRAELLAALFALLAVYAAVERNSVAWSAVALAAGLLSKENAAVAPALVVWCWVVGVGRPPRRRMLTYAAGWAAIAVAYGTLRFFVLRPYERFLDVAPVFVGASFTDVRLTAVAALADVTRLLVFPLHLRADYSPDERTLVTTALDPRFIAGLLCLVMWAVLLALAWRRGRRVEAVGLGWLALAFLPVANLAFPIGVLIAERTLYLPSVGLLLAAGSLLKDLPARRLWPLLAVVVLAGGLRSAMRVPVWRDDRSLAMSMLEDSPRSSVGSWGVGAILQRSGNAERALAAFLVALRIERRNAQIYMAAADAAFTLGRNRLADSLLNEAERACHRCLGNYSQQARAARGRGDTLTADSLSARAARLERGR